MKGKSKSPKKEKHDFKKSLKPECPDGYILRNAYRTRSDKYVPERCIRKVSILPGKGTERAERARSAKKLSQRNAEKLLKEHCKNGKCEIPSKCGKGEILRSGYIKEGYERKSYRRKDGSKVKGSRVEMTIVEPGCIKNRGAPGKTTKKIFIDPTEHSLSAYGYDHVKDLTERQRHIRLHKLLRDLISKYGEMRAYNTIIKMLNGRAQLLSRTSPSVSRIFKADQEWISAEYDLKKNK